VADWRSDAACHDHPKADWWFGSYAEQQEAAAVCVDVCPVREPCLEFAIATRQDFGVWGGLTDDQRRSLTRRSRAGRRSVSR
jgi:WhiB family transcriptional regulator, redox-sensing transcriptional regulator